MGKITIWAMAAMGPRRPWPIILVNSQIEAKAVLVNGHCTWPNDKAVAKYDGKQTLCRINWDSEFTSTMGYRLALLITSTICNCQIANLVMGTAIYEFND